MLARMRGPAWQRVGAWFRAVGILLLLASFLAPLPALALLAVLGVGAVLFLVGALAWIGKDGEPWLRR